MIYILTEGEYSNYSILGIYEGPDGYSEFGLKRAFILEKGLKPLEGSRSGYFLKYAGEGFHDWLTTKMGLKLLPHEEIHEDSYGKFEFGDREEITALLGDQKEKS